MSDTLHTLRESLKNHLELRDQAIERVKIAQLQLNEAIGTMLAEEQFILDREIKIRTLMRRSTKNFVINYDFLASNGLIEEKTQVISAQDRFEAKRLFNTNCQETHIMPYVRVTSIHEQSQV